MSTNAHTTDDRTTTQKKQDDFADKILGATIGMVFTPLWVLYHNTADGVRSNAASDRPQVKPEQLLGLFIFPLVWLAISFLFPTPVLAFLVAAPLAWLALAKKIAGRELIDFSTFEVIKSLRLLPKWVLISTAVAIAATLGLALFTDQTAVSGVLVIYSGYLAAYLLGKSRVDIVQYRQAKEDAARRTVGLALGLTEAQAAGLFIQVTGAGESTQIRTGELSLDLVGKISNLDAGLMQYAPDYMKIHAGQDGVVLGMATPEVIAQRERLLASGGLVAGVTEQAPHAQPGFSQGTTAFSPGEAF